MRRSPGRIALVTLGLVGIGVVCGAVLCGTAFVVDLAANPGRKDLDWTLSFVIGAYVGALFGAVLAPLVAWIFLRRVSIGRAIGQTALGALVGIGIGAILRPGASSVFGLVGFLFAGVGLWITTRKHWISHVPDDFKV